MCWKVSFKCRNLSQELLDLCQSKWEIFIKERVLNKTAMEVILLSHF